MASYYDFVLALIPLSLLGVAGLFTGIGLDVTLALPLGATVAAGLIGHAMFVRAPIETPEAPEPTNRGFTPAAD